MSENERTIYTIRATVTAIPRANGMVKEKREATILVYMRDIEHHTSIDILEETRGLTKLGYAVTLMVED